MTLEFTPGSEIQRGDLDVFFQDSCNVPTNVYQITYNLYYVDPGPPETEVLIGCEDREPVNPQIGEYFAALFVPPNAQLGTYRIRWSFIRENGGTASTGVMEFLVVEKGSSQVTYSQCVKDLVRRLRIHLRDQSPDIHYRFRPPEHEGRIGAYNRVFGQIWEDYELVEYLQKALEDWNAAPVTTPWLCSLDTLCQQYPMWKGYIITGAMFWALYALAINWVADEFDYSIGGISLNIDKSSKYETMKQNAKAQWDQQLENKKLTVNHVMGLQQPRLGIGVRSAFGPHVGRGVLSPRNFF